MKDMYIPRLFDLPKFKPVDPSKPVTGTVSRKVMMAMVGALQDVGLIVRAEDRGYVCMVNGKEVLRAKRGKNGTYLARYAPGVMKMVKK